MKKKNNEEALLCNVCYKTIKYDEKALLSAHWGYDSGKDLQKHTCTMCEICYDKVVEFIQSLGGNIKIEYNWPW